MTIARADVLALPTLAIRARFALAPGVVGLVVRFDQSLDPLVDDGSEFLLLATAVMASAFARLTGRQPRIVPH